jgi:hypothetical protein
MVGTTVTDIPWPQEEEQFSEPAHSAIDALLTLDPILRPAASQVKQMPLFSEIDWNNLLSATAPFVPQPDDSTDTVYFQGIAYGSEGLQKDCTSNPALQYVRGFHGSDYEECHLLGYKNPVCTSQETHYVSSTKSNQLMLCKI